MFASEGWHSFLFSRCCNMWNSGEGDGEQPSVFPPINLTKHRILGWIIDPRHHNFGPLMKNIGLRNVQFKVPIGPLGSKQLETSQVDLSTWLGWPGKVLIPEDPDIEDKWAALVWLVGYVVSVSFGPLDHSMSWLDCNHLIILVTGLPCFGWLWQLGSWRPRCGCQMWLSDGWGSFLCARVGMHSTITDMHPRSSQDQECAGGRLVRSYRGSVPGSRSEKETTQCQCGIPTASGLPVDPSTRSTSEHLTEARKWTFSTLEDGFPVQNTGSSYLCLKHIPCSSTPL